MSYLVDGNNVMGQRVGWHRDKPRARRELMDDLARFAARKRISVHVVFDGAPDEFYPDGSGYKGITVYYAHRRSNADERIKAMVEASKERQTLRVVTSDRALADYVRRCGVKVIPSGEFRKGLENCQPSPDNVAAPESPEEGWYRYFGVDPDK